MRDIIQPFVPRSSLKLWASANHEVVLASASPRRIELLKHVFSHFEVLPADLDEEAYTVANPFETASALACAKASKISALRPKALVIGADTVVAVHGTQLSKPTNEEDAKRMLRLLSGKSHSVITAVCLLIADEGANLAEETQVTFRKLDNYEIDEYVATGEPMDKAGGYAIQGGARSFVQHVSGSISNVVGLPMETLERGILAVLAKSQNPRSKPD